MKKSVTILCIVLSIHCFVSAQPGKEQMKEMPGYCNNAGWTLYNINADTADNKGQVLLYHLTAGNLDKINRLLMERIFYHNEDTSNVHTDKELMKFITTPYDSMEENESDTGYRPTCTMFTEMGFCVDGLLVYKTENNCRGDVGSPYVDNYIIDTKLFRFIDTSDMFVIDQRFKQFLYAYCQQHIRTIVNRYKEILSNGFGIAVYREQQIFDRKSYDLQKVHVSTKEISLYDINARGVTLEIGVFDSNFHNGNQKDHHYVSQILVPYILLLPYMKTTMPGYPALKKLAQQAH